MTGASAKTVPAPYSVLVSGKRFQVRIYKRVNKPVKLVLVTKITTIITATNTNNAQRFEKTRKKRLLLKKKQNKQLGLVWTKSDTQFWVCIGICKHVKPVTSEALWDTGYNNLVWRCTFKWCII